ncbi:hypothetical protein OAS86_01860 [Gammaproteobacteria bacterium]|nr:hypothetical protein [Gammaproteobacteria bacterium]
MNKNFPRLFCIIATKAPVAAVFWRGPRGWWHIGRWDLINYRYESGAWYRGTLYPQRCDLSPCGDWLAYITLNVGANWKPGWTYTAISKLPWLRAQAAWEEHGTYTRGIHFESKFVVDSFTGAGFFDHLTDAAGFRPYGRFKGAPTIGNAQRCFQTYGLQNTPPWQFAVERRRGWVETANTPPREKLDYWDQNRLVAMEKPRPNHPHDMLSVNGKFAAYRQAPHSNLPSESFYRLSQSGHQTTLEEAAWADWSHDGSLLVATRDGRLQIRDVDSHPGILFEHDLSAIQPNPRAAPT